MCVIIQNMEITEKQCRWCKETKPTSEFNKMAKSSDGHQAYCRECGRSNVRQWRSENVDRRKKYEKEYQAAHKEQYYQYGVAYRAKNVEKVRAVRKEYAIYNPERCMINDAKKRAKKRNVPITITYQDVFIPEYCPVLGIKLERNINGGRPTDNSPALDAIIPSRGYVPGNIAVISHRANRIKTDASLQELELVTAWVRKVTQSEEPSCS